MEEGSASDGRWEIYEPQKREFECIVEVPPQNYVIIDTSQPIDRILRQILDRITEE